MIGAMVATLLEEVASFLKAEVGIMEREDDK